MRDPLDRDHTPMALAKKLVGLLPFSSPSGHGLTILEPHVGAGAFAYAVQLHMPDAQLYCNDIDPERSHVPGTQVSSQDFLTPDFFKDFHWIVGNPPFKNAEAHVRHALKSASNVAFLLRVGFLGSKKRAAFFEEHPPSIIYIIQGRPNFREGRINGRTGKPYSTDNSDYAFYVWLDGWDKETVTRWVSWEKDRKERPDETRDSTGTTVEADAQALVVEVDVERGDDVATPPTDGRSPMKKLIDPGPSEAGWHRIQSVLTCPNKFRLNQTVPWEASPPLVKGSLIHVGLAHLYKQKQLRDKGKSIDKYWSPHEAIAVLSAQKAPDSDLWPELAPMAQRVLKMYEEFWGEGSELDKQWRVLAVEKEMRIMVKDDERWLHADDPVMLWTEAEKLAHDFSQRAMNPAHPSSFSRARYLYTQRADLIVQHRSTKLVYIVDHKTASRPVPNIMKRHAMTGQFLGYRMFGSLTYKESFGGVIVNAIRLTDTENPKGPLFKRPKLPRVIDSHQKLKATIIHAERLIREYTGKAHWPHALQESACWLYGGCPVRDACQYGTEGEE